MQELYKNKYKVYIKINGEYVDCTSQVPFPIKWASLLDEQLDESSLTILNASTSVIKPMTNVKVEVWNEQSPTDIITKHFIVSEDKADEIPVGSGKYKHLLSLIEETKYLERFIVRSHGYVNSLGRIYNGTQMPAPVSFYATGDNGKKPYLSSNNYVTPYLLSQELPIAGAKNLYRDYIAEFPYTSGFTTFSLQYTYSITVTNIDTGEDIYSTTTTQATDNTVIDFITPPSLGTYQIKTVTEFVEVADNTTQTYPHTATANFLLQVVANANTLPKWNARTVIERALAIAETLREGETPRFSLNEEQATAFESIETPEFSFTQSTLREILQDVGKYVHGEPRLIDSVIYYDLYGSNEQNTVSTSNYAKLSVAQSIEQYATELDSSVDNLVNSLGYVKKTITEPFEGGYKSLRTETLYARIEDGSAIISTAFPIYEVSKVVWKGTDGEYDITPYIFESTEYARLSSYEELYPQSRAYAIYYTQGEKNIQGLWFKLQKAWGAEFGDYSIVRILKTVSGISDLNISSYPSLEFQVTYSPIYSARVLQSKSYIGDFEKHSALAYNQGQNLIETHYYGENLKGVISRMGNVDKAVTFVRWGLSDIPKVGTLFDNDYYISTVSVEVQPFTTKVQLGLSKDFNRLSAYIGINSLKRFYEVSERQAVESHISYRDYIVIGDRVENEGANEVLFNVNTIPLTFTQDLSGFESISGVVAQGEDKDGNLLGEVVLPVQTAAIGNSAVFTARYEDNYSAGQQAVKLTETTDGGETVSGYFAKGVPYSDVHGNIEKLRLVYPVSIEQLQDGNNAFLLPSSTGAEESNDVFISTGARPLIVKKGSTEVPTIDYQIDFVTNRNNIIIGSALPRRTPFLSTGDTSEQAELWVLPNRLNKFINKVDLTGATRLGAITSVSGNPISGYTFPGFTSSVSGLSWAIVTGTSKELLIGCNKIIQQGNNPTDNLFISVKHKLF